MIVDSQREYIIVNKFYQLKSCTTTYIVKLYVFICRMDAQNLKLTVIAFTTVVLSILAWVLPFYVYLKIYATMIKHALKLILFERILFQFASKKLAKYFSGILESRKYGGPFGFFGYIYFCEGDIFFSLEKEKYF